jgi:hypothetical protein
MHSIDVPAAGADFCPVVGAKQLHHAEKDQHQSLMPEIQYERAPRLE